MLKFRIDQNTLSWFSGTITAAVGLVVIGWWFGYDPTDDYVMLVPGMDGRSSAEVLAASEEAVSIGEFFEAYAASPSELPGEWPRFRGPDSDNVARQNVRLADSWGPEGPERLWSVVLGEGHAAPAVKNGRVYILDYDEQEKADALRCLSLDDGAEIWRRWYRVKVKRNHGFSRTIPAVTDRHVVTIGPRAHVMCVDAITGDYLWGIDCERDYGTDIPFWYTGQCPLIDGDRVIIAPGGTALMIAIHIATGEILWETPNPNGWKMSHASVIPMELEGKRLFVYSAIGGTVGILAEGEDQGRILWETTLWNHSVIAPSPLVLSGNRLFLTAGYGAGSMVIRIVENEGVYTCEAQSAFTPDLGPASEQQTPLFYRGHLFCIQPKDAGALREQFVCYYPEDFTRPVWFSGETQRFGLGPYLIADGKIFILNDDGILTMIEASTAAYRPLAQAKILDGHDAWGPIALAGTRMLLRDSGQMVCIDIGTH